MKSPPYAIVAGDRAPNFGLPRHDGGGLDLYGHVRARPTVLTFCGGSPQAVEKHLRAFAKRQDRLGELGAALIAVTPAPPEANAALAGKLKLGFPLLSDAEGRAFGLYAQPRHRGPGAAPRSGPVTFALDRNQRVLAAVDGGGGLDQARRAVEALEAGAAAGAVEQPPPILIIPNVLSPSHCRDLVELWRTGGHEEGTVGLATESGAYKGVTSDQRRARDHVIRDPRLEAELLATIGPRIGDEVYKAFNFTLAYIAELQVICYDAERGDYFKPHRDNWNPANLHRRFALSLSLNAGEFDGGGVWFPEYSSQVFNPPLGGAVVFSCSLLHEALPVTQGQRFILSAFMWGQEDQRQREARARQAGAGS